MSVEHQHLDGRGMLRMEFFRILQQLSQHELDRLLREHEARAQQLVRTRHGDRLYAHRSADGLHQRG